MFDYHAYRAYLKTEAWRALRAAVICRARGMCERCGKWPVVNVHHLTYERLFHERLEDLLGVCSKCHRELHHDDESVGVGSYLPERSVRGVC